MKLIADLHFHSKYSRAVSQQMVLPEIAEWARIKGIDLITTSDFTHPVWFREIKANLEETGEGIYKLKSEIRNPKYETNSNDQNNKFQTEPRFILTTEISCIYTQGGKGRRIHLVVMAPSISEVEKINTELAKRGNLMSDGRPILGMSARDLTALVLGASPETLIIPAHAWTPWFSLYGSESGFDSIEECFGDMAKYIFAVETGLSSSPEMNWRIGELDNRSIISCSDAHSGAKLGREATVFAASENGIINDQLPITNLSYEDIRRAIMGESGKIKIAHTIEFYPEEGKYHYTGHRNCQLKQSPEETKRLGATCPVCGKGLTVGVMHRVEQLATREIGNPLQDKQELGISHDEFGVEWIGYAGRPPYVMMVPLMEILAEALESTVSSQKTIIEYKKLTEGLGGEFKVLLETKTEEIAKISGSRVAEGIKKVRTGDIVVDPGYDGVFGTVKIWPLADARGKPPDSGEEKEQLALF